MLSKEELQNLSRAARISLDEQEQALLCRDLGVLLEMVSVLEDLTPPKDARISSKADRLCDLREDLAMTDVFSADGRECYAVPRAVEKS